MKKRSVIFITLILALLVSVFGLIACDRTNNDGSNGEIDNGTNSEETMTGDNDKDVINGDPQILRIYEMYVSNTKANGETPLSYEEWIKSIKGANGKSSYEIWLANGYSGTEEDFLTWLKGGGNESNPQGLDFYPLSDGTYAVSFGKAWLLDEITIPATYNGKPVSKFFEPYDVDYDFNNQKIYYTGTVNDWVKMEKRSAYDFGEDNVEFFINGTPASEITELAINQNIAYGGLIGLCSLKTLTIGKDVKNIDYFWCYTLESITVDAANPYYSSQSGILYNKAKTEIIHFPYCISGDVVIPDGVTSIGYVFSYRSSLESVTIGNGVTSIGYGAFRNCTSLESVTIGNGVTSIGSDAFEGCSSLTSVTIGSGVTSIGSDAFEGCSSLTSVTIGSGVTSIGNRAFYDCEALDTIYYKGSKTTWNNITYDSYDVLPSSTTLYYYSETTPIKEGNFWHYVNGEVTVWEDIATVYLYKRVNENDEEAENGNYVYFGYYPQTDVTAKNGEELTSAYASVLPENGTNNGWTSYKYYMNNSNETDYMWYKDVDVDDNGSNDYRAVYFVSYRPSYISSSSSAYDTYQDDNGYNRNTVYWFKFEPIKWRILSEENGKALIFAELIIDSMNYNDKGTRQIDEKTVYANNYEYSTIRAWLNDNFYNAAFNTLQKALINTVEVDNSARSTNPDNDGTYFNEGVNSYACNNTYDNVWLLSVREISTAKYGFSESLSDFYSDYGRYKSASDYAKCQGEGRGNNSYTDKYWLRSPSCSGSSYICYLYNSGSSFSYYQDYDSTDFGVVPALQISFMPELF